MSARTPLLTPGCFYIWQDRYGFTISAYTDRRNIWGATFVASDAPHFGTEAEARCWLEKRVEEVNSNMAVPL